MQALVYLLSFVLFGSTWLGFQLGGWWSFLPLGIAFGLIPLLELFLKPDAENASGSTLNLRLKNGLYDGLLYACVPLHFGFMLYYLFLMKGASNTSGLSLAGYTVSMAILNGVFGINVAHELGHRTRPFERFLAQALLSSTLYAHFYIEHNRGHHKHVGSALDPATARLNEWLYTFWIRSIVGSYVSAWKLEAERLKRFKKGVLSAQNAMLWYSLISLGMLFGIGLWGGWWSLLGFLLSALGGILLLETVNYIEHYGLMRQKVGPNRYENVRPVHSWNSNHRIGRWFLFELSRHSDHHHQPHKKYQTLAHHEDSPQLPTGYPGMMLLSLLPPLFFWVMNRRLPA